MGNEISSVVYVYYILDGIITIYTVNKEFPALERWKLLSLMVWLNYRKSQIIKLVSKCERGRNIHCMMQQWKVEMI